MAMIKKIGVILIIFLFFSGCSTIGSNYVPLVDMKNKDPGTFDIDTHECQTYARQRMDAAQGAVAGAIVAGLLGAFLASSGSRNYVAGRTAGIGALTGAVNANDNQETITKRCLAGRGYNVLN